MSETASVFGFKVNVFDLKTWIVVTMIVFLVYYSLGLVQIV